LLDGMEILEQVAESVLWHNWAEQIVAHSIEKVLS
jgi:hypothetical protein